MNPVNLGGGIWFKKPPLQATIGIDPRNKRESPGPDRVMKRFSPQKIQTHIGPQQTHIGPQQTHIGPQQTRNATQTIVKENQVAKERYSPTKIIANTIQTIQTRVAHSKHPEQTSDNVKNRGISKHQDKGTIARQGQGITNTQYTDVKKRKGSKQRVGFDNGAMFINNDPKSFVQYLGQNPAETYHDIKARLTAAKTRSKLISTNPYARDRDERRKQKTLLGRLQLGISKTLRQKKANDSVRRRYNKLYEKSLGISRKYMNELEKNEKEIELNNIYQRQMVMYTLDGEVVLIDDVNAEDPSDVFEVFDEYYSIIQVAEDVITAASKQRGSKEEYVAKIYGQKGEDPKKAYERIRKLRGSFIEFRWIPRPDGEYEIVRTHVKRNDIQKRQDQAMGIRKTNAYVTKRVNK